MIGQNIEIKSDKFIENATFADQELVLRLDNKVHEEKIKYTYSSYTKSILAENMDYKISLFGNEYEFKIVIRDNNGKLIIIPTSLIIEYKSNLLK